MREIFTYGEVGRAPGNRCLYPEQRTGKTMPFSALIKSSINFPFA
jgi:hypothetical protein